MKTFLQLVEEKEKTHKPVVMAFGRFNPPTTGHLKLIDKVKETAEKKKAAHTVIVSHSQDSKKNPLSSAQKLKHLKRYSPGTNFEASNKEHPTIMHHAERLHKAGHDHLIMVAGSDRVKEYHDLLHKYNGKPNKDGHVPYHFKKIEVVSAGHRDPDAEGAEGMSGSKMREHAKNNDFSSFRQGVPSHVSDHHTKQLMNDVRKGMGLNEEINRGQFKAIFVTGGPGSGKDIVIREAIAESRIVELNFVQAIDYLGDKQKLSENAHDFRAEAIRKRMPLIINGPADDNYKISYIKEELEELGYETMMIFVNTSNESSRDRNSSLSKVMLESVRQNKWVKSQHNNTLFSKSFKNFISFDNTENIDTIREGITDVYELTKLFLDEKTINESASSWLDKNYNINKAADLFFKENKNVKKDSKSIQKNTITKNNIFYSNAKGPADITPDNRSGQTGFDSIKGGTFPRKNPNGVTYTFGSGSGTYAEEKEPTLKFSTKEKEPNFQKDNDKNKKIKRGDTSSKNTRVGRPDGIGSTLNTRTNGSGLTGGAGLGDSTYSEDQEYSNAQPSSAAIPGSSALQPNPLSNSYEPKKKNFNNFRKNIKEFNGFQNDTGSGLGGVLGGASNKEGMDTYKDAMRNIGTMIKNNKKKNEKKI